MLLQSNLTITQIFINILGVIRCILLLQFDCLCCFFILGRKRETKKKVLFVRLDTIGDFILWLDAAKELKKLFLSNEYEITLLGNQTWTSLAKTLPYFDRVYSLNREKFLNNWYYRLKILKKIRQIGFQVIVHPTFSREFLFGDAIVRISGAKERIGFQGDCSNIRPWQKWISDHWYTRLIAATKEPLMELERNAEFMTRLSLSEFKAGIPELPVTETLPKPKGFNVDDYYILLPGASKEAKRWPLSNFVELARRIYQATGLTALICGGHGEEALGKILEQDAGVPLQNWVGLTSLEELVAIIAGAHMLIGNDTGAVHISAAVLTPAVCILGGGHYGRFMPYRLEIETEKPLPIAVVNKTDCFGCNWRCIHDGARDMAAPCVAHISVDMVWKAAKKILDKAGLTMH